MYAVSHTPDFSPICENYQNRLTTQISQIMKYLKRTRNETYSPKLDVGICIPYTY